MAAINRIRTEQPYKKMWDMYYLFENEETTRSFLESRYHTSGRKDPQRDAYFATAKLIFNTKQAREYYRSAEQCDIITKPLLLYYGMVSLIKALIVTYDPEYPATTSVLKHGLSTRKLKREDYQFINDDVRVQKDGLFPAFYQTLYRNTLTYQQKLPMRYMLSAIPDIRHMYERLYGPSCVANVEITRNQPTNVVDFTCSYVWKCNRSILQGSQKTKQEAIDTLTNASLDENEYFSVSETPEPMGQLFLIRYTKTQQPLDHPLLLYDLMGEPFLYLPKHPSHQIPELCIHFLVMYVLGMLCRYETERWGELIFNYASQDLVIINEFLSLSMRKFPNLILNELLQEIYYFYSV